MRKTRKLFAVILALGLILSQAPGITVAAETTTDFSESEVVTEITTERVILADGTASISEDVEESANQEDALTDAADKAIMKEDSVASPESSEVEETESTDIAEETTGNNESAAAQNISAKKGPARAPATYTVSFDTAGGTAIAAQTITSGGKATEPSAPTRNDYLFLGWFEDYARTMLFDFNTPITKDTTIFARMVKRAPIQYIDNTVDESTSVVIGKVIATNTATGETTTTEVYNQDKSVTYSNPKSEEVIEMINAAISAGDSYISTQNYTKKGTETSETQDDPWDNRVYTNEQQEEEQQADGSFISSTLKFTASGGYGIRTIYTVTIEAEYDGHIHDWNDPTYTWSSDNKTVTATRVCKDDAAHVETETVSTTSETTKAATCATKGETTYTATFENAAFDTQTKTVEDVALDLNAHDWDDGTITTNPTCTEKGVKTFTCKNDASHTKTEDVDALGHDWGPWTQAKAPTCTEEGTEERVCNHDASHKEARSVEKIDHTWDAGVVTKDATCEESGVKTYTCTACGETKTEAIAVLGHNWDDGVITKEATCTEKGIKTFTCKNDTNHTKTEDVEALGHDWSAWTVTKEATEAEDGEETRTCSVCGETETRSIPHLIVEYRNTEGDGSKWEKGSSESLKFVFKRSINDETSFSHFTGIQVDGNNVDASNYIAVSGSVVVNLKPAYLETLATGEHTITAIFDDGNNPTAKFTITEKTKPASTDNSDNTKDKTPAKTNDTKTASTSPATGDNSNIALWGIVMIASLLCLIFVLISRLSYLRRR